MSFNQLVSEADMYGITHYPGYELAGVSVLSGKGKLLYTNGNIAILVDIMVGKQSFLAKAESKTILQIGG